MLLNRQTILAVQDGKTIEVPVPEWGPEASVLVGSMGALDRARLQDWLDGLGRPKEPDEGEPISCDAPEETPEKEYTAAENMEVMVRWCVLSILDPQTRQAAFTEEDLEALGRKSFAALVRIYEAALSLNRATAEAAQDFEKNSGGTPGGSSGGA